MSFHPSMGQDTLPRHATTVTCVLPGLIWPASGIATSLQSLKLPGLAAILGHGKILQQEGQPSHAWLGDQFGASDLPWGALRLAGETQSSRTPLEVSGGVLCADPVSFAFTRDALLVRSPHDLALTPTEVDALLAALNAEFSDLGQFHAASPERWYLETSRPSARFHPLADVIGRPAAYFPPEGEQAREWNRIANEIQVFLHAHPVNQARSEDGRLTANALWFWGQGGAATPKLESPAARIVSADPLVRGLASMTATQIIDPTAVGSPAFGLPGHTWWHDQSLQEAALIGDFGAWCEALERIDSHLLQPLWQACDNGKLHNFVLAAPSDKASLITTVKGRTARWAFWRKPVDMATLSRLLQAPEQTVRPSQP